MKLEVFHTDIAQDKFYQNGEIRDVDLSVTRAEIEQQQESNTFHQAQTLCRVKLYDEKTGKYCYFCITPTVRNGRPGLELEAIGKVNETKRTRLLGNWKVKEPR